MRANPMDDRKWAVDVEQVKDVVREEIAKGKDSSLQLRIIYRINGLPKHLQEAAHAQ